MVVLCGDGEAHMRVVRSQLHHQHHTWAVNRSILPDLRRGDAGPVSGQGTSKLNTRISL
jgi:hypothetical protein